MKAQNTLMQSAQEISSITANGMVGGEYATFIAKRGLKGTYTLGRKFGLAEGEEPHHGSAAMPVKALKDVEELVRSNGGKDYSLWCYYVSEDGKTRRRNLYSLDALNFNYLSS
ncbi:hypothetical protein OQJ65_17170 [Vibrio sp. Sgm 22]|uniref:hypothetical protein n=1 Tax=unclassified Vibrio TaxID=2614977 RepID=UPI002248D7BE|nr:MULTISPECIES: hypothetical protein [unclassified Vibrio]MCX2760067.1 hypothetical protein [Vibrio sp. 14G-20]MCX2777055.1 hypothetical protein [Vibrio sp. Sgm 22]